MVKSGVAKPAAAGAGKRVASKSARTNRATPVAKAEPVIAEKPVTPATKGAKPASAAAAKPDAREKADKPKKIKLVRDSFTMPETEYAALGEVKKACLKAGVEVKKSELLRIGVAMVRQLDIEKLKELRAALPVLKAGRPKASK